MLPSGEPAGSAVNSRTKPAHRILVVEDDCEIRRLNSEVLKSSGYEVDAAEDGAEAWETLQIKVFNLMVTDNEMPRVSGVELLKKLHAARMALPTIMATGDLPREEFKRSPWLQPSAMLTKPYTIEELLGTVQEVLRATDGVREATAPPPDWQSLSPEDGWKV